MGNSKSASLLRWVSPSQHGLNCSILLWGALAGWLPNAAQAQSIIPANDGTGTQVQAQGNELIIQGGSFSGDRTNLFHSFDRFDIAANEIATFQSAPNIQNIIGRVFGSDASRIDGTLRISNGTSQLILINPAGIISGLNSEITAPGGFTATTADRIGFDATSLDSLLTVSDYSSFNGTPTSFEIGSGSQGSILTEGTIETAPGQAIRLIGRQVVNTGQLTAPSGEITLLSLGSGQLANFTGTSLEQQSGSNAPGSPGLSLPQLTVGEATNLEFTPDGQLRLTGTSAPSAASTTEVVVSGDLEVAGESGQIRVVGDRVALLNPSVNAFGDTPNLAGRITIEAGSISGGSLNAGNVDDFGRVSTAAPDISLMANGDVILEQLLGRNIAITSETGNISLSLGDGNEGSRTVRAQTVSLSAPAGRVDLDGGIQAGEVERSEPGRITITAQQFQAINPFGTTALVDPDQTLVSMSLWAFPANVPNLENIETPPDPFPVGAVEIRLGEGFIPTQIGTGETLISINLQDDVFAIGDGINDPAQPFSLGNRSGTEGGIGTGLSRVPPNVNPLALNNEFVSFESPSAAVAEVLLDDGEAVASALCSSINELEDNDGVILQALAIPEQPAELSPSDIGLSTVDPVESVEQPDGADAVRSAQTNTTDNLSCGRE